MRPINSKIFILFPVFLIACNRQSTENNSSFQEPTIKTMDSLLIIKSLFLESDTVLLIGHLGRANQGRNHEDTIPAIIVDGRPNGSIIKTKKVLNKTEIDSLLSILLKPDSAYLGPPKCQFDPHHSIILIRGSAFSYIDLCFMCQQFATTTDLKYLPQFDSWDRLENFYKGYQVRYYSK